MFRWHVVSAVFWRNVKQYFSGVLGYLFIVVFVTVCAVLAFNQQFFANNLANLDQLSRWFPFLLLVFIPAITMTVWAEEKRSGTDAILFTLPASDFEIMLGKYLSVAMVYTIALFFSLTQLIALERIGNPDWGVIGATYLGYWLSGLSFLAIGMFASSLTSSVTISFVIGTTLCAIPVFIGLISQGTVWLEKLGVAWNLQDFTEGLIPLGNVVYFLSIIVLMLYLNLVVVSQRHWSRGQSSSLAGHYFMRIACLAVALLCCNYVASTLSNNNWTRADLTKEKLYTLDETTLATIEKARANKRPITIQAFISTEVPRKFVNVKKQFLGLLRQYDFYGGNYVNVRYVDVAASSPQEAEARNSGIVPIDDRSEVGGRTVEQQVFLGALVSSPLDDVTIPSIDQNTSLEYQLTRSISITAEKAKKLTIGILDTDTHFGCQTATGTPLPSWWAYSETLNRLKVNFNIKQIPQNELVNYVEPPQSTASENSPDKTAARKAPNVLIVADPSSMTQASSRALLQYLAAGNPAIILADPLPFYLPFRIPRVGILGAPRLPRLEPRNPNSEFLSSAFEPKVESGTAASLLTALGIKWNNGDVAWNVANPHPNFVLKWPEGFGTRYPFESYGPYDQAVSFVRNEGGQNAFNSDSVITSGLRELLFFYPGYIEPVENATTTFTQLISLGTESGTTRWNEITYTPKQVTRDRRTGREEETAAINPITGQDLILIRGRAAGILDDKNYSVAAHIQGNENNKTNVVFVADTDFLSGAYYMQEDNLKQELDNFMFLLNAIEVLVGDRDLVALRGRNPKLKTLDKFEMQVNQFRKLRATKTAEIEKRIRVQQQNAEQELAAASQDIQNDGTMGVIQQAQMFSERRSDALERLRRKKKKLKEELDTAIDGLKSMERQQTTELENRIRWTSVMLAPLPALILGLVVLTIRTVNENRSIDPRRRIRASTNPEKEKNNG